MKKNRNLVQVTKLNASFGRNIWIFKIATVVVVGLLLPCNVRQRISARGDEYEKHYHMQ